MVDLDYTDWSPDKKTILQEIFYANRCEGDLTLLINGIDNDDWRKKIYEAFVVVGDRHLQLKKQLMSLGLNQKQIDRALTAIQMDMEG